MKRKNAELVAIKAAVKEILGEKRRQKETLSVNYLEVSKATDLPRCSVSGYLSKNYKNMGLQRVYASNKCEYHPRDDGAAERLRNYLSKLF